MVKLRDYVAVDLEISSKRYKFFRISTIKDGSLVVSPQIKPIMEGSIKGSMDDIHISQHVSGKNHIKINNLETETFHFPSITQIANRKCKWYFCINAKDKGPEEIFNLNKKKSCCYAGYYLANLSALPKEWFTIYVEISAVQRRGKLPRALLFSHEVSFKGFFIHICMCDGISKKIRSKKELSFKINPTSCRLGS